MPLQPFDQCIEGGSAAWTGAQVFVHCDPGFQGQTEMLLKQPHECIVAPGNGCLTDADSGTRSDQCQLSHVAVGDFFGPKAGNNWFSQGLIKPGKPVTAIRYPGDRGVGHQWAYLPDVARTMVDLLARRDSLESFAAFHIAGHWDADGAQMVESIRRVVTRLTATRPRIASFPWWLVALTSPFVATFREMLEMRYLWREPLRLDNARLSAVLGREPHTPLDEAVEATLAGLGCFGAPAISDVRVRSPVFPRACARQGCWKQHGDAVAPRRTLLLCPG